MNKIVSVVVLFLFCNLGISQILENGNGVAVNGDFEDCINTINPGSGECVEIGILNSCAEWTGINIDNAYICDNTYNYNGNITSNTYPAGGNYHGSMKRVVENGISTERRGLEAMMTGLVSGRRYRLSFDLANFGSDQNGNTEESGTEWNSGVAVTIGYETFYKSALPFNPDVAWQTVSVDFCTYEVTKTLRLDPTIFNTEANMSCNLGIDNVVLELLPDTAFCQKECEDCSSFELEKNKKYVISGWVKEDSGEAQQAMSYTSSIDVHIGGANSGGNVDPENDLYLEILPSGEIIDGWQRIIGEFTVPNTIGDMRIDIELKNGANSGEAAYFDDIRIHPFNGGMKSFVYDQDTQKLMSELDENNYATFYEYDKEGGLVRIKKETEKGIYTIQETRSGTIKKYEP